MDKVYKNIYEPNTHVIELVLKDFIYKDNKLYINNNHFSENKGLIIFYAPWCKHCVQMSDMFIDLAISNINIFSFGAVNYENIKDENDKLFSFAKIEKFPTIKYINSDGSLENYKHQYSENNLIYYVNTNI